MKTFIIIYSLITICCACMAFGAELTIFIPFEKPLPHDIMHYKLEMAQCALFATMGIVCLCGLIHDKKPV